MRSRNANLGTFISQEPTGKDGPNLYWSMGNNLVRYVDPSGLAYRDPRGASLVAEHRNVGRWHQ